MTLKIETFSGLKGGNSFFKAITHPGVAMAAAALLARLRSARRVALYDPLGFAAGFAGCHDLGGVALDHVFVQALADIDKPLLGRRARPVTELPESGADLVFLVAFDAQRLGQQIQHLLPPGAELVSLDLMRLPPEHLTNPRNYLDSLNFVTNFAFFRDQDGLQTRLVTANYWAHYGAGATRLVLTLFGTEGQTLAHWTEAVPTGPAGLTLESTEIRRRFGLGPFLGQLFIHVIGAAGHDVVKYALDTLDISGDSLSCTHDANSWPADFYAGLPAPADDEQVTLWVQNSLPLPIPAGSIGLNLMGSDAVSRFPETIPPFATKRLDTRDLLPSASWPQQIEIEAGRYLVRPRYEITRRGRTRIAHPNVERIDLSPNPEIPGLQARFGKGFILPAPLLPRDRWHSLLLPTPMARSQARLPIKAVLYDAEGLVQASHRFGNLPRRHDSALDLDTLIPAGSPLKSGHVELEYDWESGDAADGWLHALFRYRDRNSGHEAETSFGAHIFNTILSWRDEPQSYAGRAPGLTTRLFLRLGPAPLDTLCQLIYPASLPWHPESATDIILHDSTGIAIAQQRLAIPCGGSRFWLYSEIFTATERHRAMGGYITIRDQSCRLFGYHGLMGEAGRFSLDHMFGF